MNNGYLSALAIITLCAMSSFVRGQEMDEMWGESTFKLRASDAERGQLFDEGNYAMFIHWGLYSFLGNKVEGKTYYGIGEWIMKDRQSSTSTTPGFSPSELISLIPAVIEGSGNPNANGAMEIILPGGTRLSITSAHHVALAVSLIRELNILRPC